MNPKADSLKRPVNKPLKNIFLDFPGGPVFKTHASNAGGTGPSLVQGTKIPHAMQCSQKKNYVKNLKNIFSKGKREKTQTTNITSKRGDITTDPTDIKQPLRKSCEQLYAHPFDALGEIVFQFLERHKLPKLTQEEKDSLNRRESPKMNPHLYGRLIYTKETRISNREKTASSINGVGKTGQLHAKESNWTSFSHHIQK